MSGVSAEIDRFRRVIGQRLGLHFDEARQEFLTGILRERSHARGTSESAYLHDLEDAARATAELRDLAEHLTVGETYFFRNSEQLLAFQEVCLPDRVKARRAEGVLRILSAGCATGEEPYSLAMLVQDRLPEAAGWRVDIKGVDVDVSAIARARRGRYSSWSLRDTPDSLRNRWFRPEAREFILDEKIRSRVRFEVRNLAAEDPALWESEKYDVIFFRNVVMYFTPEQAQAVVSRIERSLAPGGFLFLGHAENLRGVESGFALCHSHGTFYYQHGDTRSDVNALPPAPALACAAGRVASLGAVAQDSGSWFESILQASARIQDLAEKPALQRDSIVKEAPGDLASLLDLLRCERFLEALACIGALPCDSSRTPEVLLLRATLLLHSGDLDEAELCCSELLEADESNAGAQYLIALCREGSGDRQKAIEGYEKAIDLDSAFAMPRLHLGLLARRSGNHGKARRELGHALALLRREHPARLLLFGGGFRRDALVALCRAELAWCGDGR